MLGACGGGPVGGSGSSPTAPSPETTTGSEAPLSEGGSEGLATSTTSTGSPTTPAEGSQTTTTTGGLQPRTTTTRVPQGDSTAIPEWFADQADLPAALSIAIKEQLAANVGTSIDRITESGAMFVTWRDSGLGCSSAGEMNLQVLTDGYLAYFDVDGVSYRVHTDTGSAFRICDQSTPPNPVDQM
jgi:hypothetical protein